MLITGAGRAFSAGQDLADPLVEPDGSPKDIGLMLEHNYIPLALRLRSMPVPVVAGMPIIGNIGDGTLLWPQ